MRPDEYRRLCIRLCLAQALLFASVALAADTADTIFLGCDILTMRGPRPEHAEAIAVRGGMILYVGPAAAARALAGAATREVDLGGRRKRRRRALSRRVSSPTS